MTSNYPGQLLIQRNKLVNNFGGVLAFTDTNRYPGNIDADSACGVPFSTLEQVNSLTYYQQNEELTTNADTTITGSSVSSTGGTLTVCSNYGQSPTRVTGFEQQKLHAPSPGQAVFDMKANTYLGTVATVTSPNSFTLSGSPGNRSGASLMISSYGGCGAADYFGGAPGVRTGNPAALYWDNCIWGSRNIIVSGNTFTMDPSAITGCSYSVNRCGAMSAFVVNAGVPLLMQFWDSYLNLIAKAQGGLGNVWSGNVYSTQRAWHFITGPGSVSQAQWIAPPYSQDAGSNF